MSKVTEKKEENFEGVKEQIEEELLKETEEQEAETEVPAESNSPFKPSTYLGLGIILLAVILLVLYKMFGKKKAEQPVVSTQKNESVKDDQMSVSAETSCANVHEQGAREDQQDSFSVSDLGNSELVQKKGILLTVADGMGGLNNGGRISSLTVTVCQNLFHAMPEYLPAAEMLLEMATQVNREVNQFLSGKERGGSTLVAAIIRGNMLHFLTIGDSRIYLYRNGALLQLNREHVYKEELALLAVNGRMPVGRIGLDPQAKSLTSYLGNGHIVHLDRNTEGIRLIDKDKIILASDGVFGTLIPEQMEQAFKLSSEEATVKIREMVEEVKKPYQDNYTAVILEYRE